MQFDLKPLKPAHDDAVTTSFQRVRTFYRPLKRRYVSIGNVPIWYFLVWSYCNLFKIFYFIQADPLLHLTQFLEAFIYDQENDRTVSLLSVFQHEYQAFRNRNIVGKDFSSEGDCYYCEDFAVQCVMILLEQSESTYHACKLVRYLAESKFGNMFNRQG